MRRVVPAMLVMLLVACAAAPSAIGPSTGPAASLAGEASTPPVPGTAPQGATTVARVVAVTDGDTIRVEIDGVEYPLRYIGLDSPETDDPDPAAQAFAESATATNLALVGGATVVLELDVSETDRFDRLLRYVWLERGSSWLMVNRKLVRLGAALAEAYPPDTKYQELLDAAEAEARSAEVGMWVTPAATIIPFVPPPVTPTPIPAATPSPVPVVTPAPTPAANCDAAYPTVCIPPPPPDLDCGDITFRRFQVLAPDPHGFDGSDDDGIGCESD